MAMDEVKGPRQADPDVRARIPAVQHEMTNAAQAVVQAQARVAATRRWLHEVRLEMLLGIGDTDQYDEALLDCRAAETALRAAQAARDELADLGIARSAAAPEQYQPLVAGGEATPRMRFARWLAEHGQLSEWNVREGGASDAPAARLAFARWLVQSGRLSDWPAVRRPTRGS